MMNVGSLNPNAYLSCPYFLPYHFKLKILSAVPVFLYKMFVKPSRKPSTPRKHGKQEEEAKQPKFCKQAKQISIFECCKQEAELSMVHHMCLYITYLP